MPWTSMDKNLSHICKMHLCLVGNILLSKNGPYAWQMILSFGMTFLINDGDMMFMSWSGLILSDMTWFMPPLLICI